MSRWLPLELSTIQTVGAYMGVFEIRRVGGQNVLLGYAGGTSAFGLRGELLAILLRMTSGPYEFCYEVTSSYLSRFSELRMMSPEAEVMTKEAGIYG